MKTSNSSERAPYASAWGFAVPLIGFALSLPTLLGSLVLGALAIRQAVVGDTQAVTAPVVIHLSPAFVIVVLYIVFGPIAGCVLCVTQRTRAEQVYGSVLLLGFRMKRLNTIALYCCGLAIVLFALLIVTNVVIAIVSAG